MNSIQIAWEGLQEADHERDTAIYGAQGIKLPPLKPAKPGPETIAQGMRSWAREHNARYAAERSAAAVKTRALARAAAKATQAAKTE